LKLKTSIGVSASQIKETKSNYEFKEITDPAWLDFFDVDQLSWVNTRGEDTCYQCFYAENTDELQNQMKQEYNSYSYLNVPISIGAELNFKYVSFDFMGGFQWNHLTSAQGVYIKTREPGNERLYYWNNLEFTTLTRKNDMLKTNYMSWLASVAMRVRVTKNFDLFGSYQKGASIGTITKDDYIYDKTNKQSFAKLGITYYPFRRALNPKF
jgi:hypothetical protein